MEEKHVIVDHIGLRIKKIRVNRRLKQTDLAAQLQTAGLDIDGNTISKIERGVRDVTVKELFPLAKALDVCPYWLAGFDK